MFTKMHYSYTPNSIVKRKIKIDPKIESAVDPVKKDIVKTLILVSFIFALELVLYWALKR
jgi:hypothetical protein